MVLMGLLKHTTKAQKGGQGPRELSHRGSSLRRMTAKIVIAGVFMAGGALCEQVFDHRRDLSPDQQFAVTHQERLLSTDTTETALSLDGEEVLDQQALANASAGAPSYPESIFTDEQIRSGASVLYLIGKWSTLANS